MPGGVNANQGAESTLSFMLGLLAIIESYAAVDKIHKGVEVSRKRTASREGSIAEKTTKKPTPIKDISTKGKPKKNQVEELT
jgi:hypothetical protein